MTEVAYPFFGKYLGGEGVMGGEGVRPTHLTNSTYLRFLFP